MLLPYKWEPLGNSKVEERLRSVISEWDGTPYKPNWMTKQKGCDCVRFLIGVISETFHLDMDRGLILPQDISFHNRAGAMRGFKFFADLFKLRRIKTNVIQPADIIVIGPRSGGPGHGILVGPDQNELWEAGARRVQQIGLGISDRFSIFGAFRSKDKEAWVSRLS